MPGNILVLLIQFVLFLLLCSLSNKQAYKICNPCLFHKRLARSASSAHCLLPTFLWPDKSQLNDTTSSLTQLGIVCDYVFPEH